MARIQPKISLNYLLPLLDGVLDALTGIQGVRSKPLREIAIKAMDNVQRATDFTAK